MGLIIILCVICVLYIVFAIYKVPIKNKEYFGIGDIGNVFTDAGNVLAGVGGSIGSAIVPGVFSSATHNIDINIPPQTTLWAMDTDKCNWIEI
jgi:hypothetical protein